MNDDKENEQELFIEYNQNPTPGTFQRLINHLQIQKKSDLIQEIRLDYISKFSMNEEMWLQWLEDEFKPQGDNSLYNQLLQMSLNDLPLSAKIRKFQIERAPEKERLQLIKNAIEIIGDFDNSIWDLYRKENPDKSDEIYKIQLSHPIPNYDTVLGEYNLQQVMESNPPFEPPAEVKELIDKMKLHRANFKTLSGALEHVKTIPDEKSFEYALSLYPYSTQLWVEYLNHFPKATLAARAVRFCPTSGLLWAMYAKITNKVNTAGFQFINDIAEAQLLLGQLVILDKENAIPLIKSAIDSHIFSQKDNWIWPTFLLEEHIKEKGGQDENATYDERKSLFEAAIERNSQSIELWNKLISIVSEKKDDDMIRQIYRTAASKLKVNLPVLIQNWIIFETSSNNNQMDEVISILNQLANSTQNENTDESENDPESISKDYERRTIFVANFKDQVSEEDLHQFFSQIGEVESVRVKKSHGRTTFAFVQFRYPQSADQAVRMLNGAIFNGSQIEVKPHQTQNKMTLFIRYSSNAQPSELIDFIREKAKTTNFKLRLANEKTSSTAIETKGQNRDIPQRTKGWGFIDVTKDEDAMKIMALSGKLFKTQALKVEVANKKQKEAHFEKKQSGNFQKKDQKNFKSFENQVLKEEEEDKPMNDDQLKDFFGL